MSCRHDNPPGYAFCTTCGEVLAVRRCTCGLACSMTDRYCGRCGTALDSKTAAGHSTASIERNGQYDLNVLQEVANRHKSVSTGAKTRMDQNDVRRLLQARQKGRR
jgi:hypothetical protein